MNYFQVNVKYDRQTGEDNPGKVKEIYLVKAETCSDAERIVLEEIKPFIFGDCETPKIQKRDYFDIFRSKNNEAYFEAKVEIITVDGDKEVRKTVPILVSDYDIYFALVALKGQMTGYDCEIVSIKKTGIVDILERD